MRNLETRLSRLENAGTQSDEPARIIVRVIEHSDWYGNAERDDETRVLTRDEWYGSPRKTNNEEQSENSN